MEPELRVFVYGTLRRGASNHFRMAGATFIAEGTVMARMYRFDWYPGLVLDDSADVISGEVYEVPPAQLADLDAFEGVSADEIAHNAYRRVPAMVTTRDGGVLCAWIWEWCGPTEEFQRIPNGNWLGTQLDH